MGGKLWRMLDTRLTDLENYAHGRRSVEVAQQPMCQFRIIPTCPPTTTVRITAGILLRDSWSWAYIGRDTQIPEQELDFSDPVGNEINLDLTFTNANYYKSCIIMYDEDFIFADHEYWGLAEGYTYRFIVVGGDTEYATASEAEQAIDDILNGGAVTAGYEAFRLGGVVLRNDGTTGVNGAVLPVDVLNRDRSYIYRDARQQNYFA